LISILRTKVVARMTISLNSRNLKSNLLTKKLVDLNSKTRVSIFFIIFSAKPSS
jgi:hypothetical protein